MMQRNTPQVKPQDAEANEDYACLQDVSFPSEESPPLPSQLANLNRQNSHHCLSGKLARAVSKKVLWTLVPSAGKHAAWHLPNLSWTL